MPKSPADFTGEDVPRLLAEEERRRRALQNWKGFGMAFYGFAGILLFVVCVITYLVTMFG